MTESIMDITHSDYDSSVDEILKIRDSIEGPNAVKNGERATIYLPNPFDNANNISTPIEIARKYKAYKERAEYDAFPARTEFGYSGALNSTPPSIEDIPSDIEYMLEDSDGDGLSLNESIKMTQSNMLEVKYHGLLATFTPFEDDGQPLTTLRAKALGLKAMIKHYPRESIVDWDFSVINGDRKLSYVKLAENKVSVNHETYKKENQESQFILGIDDLGYYQRRVTKDKNGNDDITDKHYPMNRDGNLQSIPFEFVIDQQSDSKELPKGFGIMYPICLKAISRYQVSADLNESLHRYAIPTVASTGWTAKAFEDYKLMTGQDTICIGGHVPLPKDATIEYLQWNADSDAMFKYLDNNQKEAKALGARFDTSDARDEAVGVAKIRSSEELSSLINIQMSIKDSYKRLLDWCYKFMSNNAEIPEYTLNLNTEFNKVKLTTQEQKEIRDNVTMGIYSREEGLRQLYEGGITTDTAEELLRESIENGDS